MVGVKNLFTDLESEKLEQNAPLAVRVRPRTLDEYVGQEQAVGEGSWLRDAIEHDTLSSIILYGPAGTGKTTLARVIAAHTQAEFIEVSAVSGSVKDLRAAIDQARTQLLSTGVKTILFVDEIHRFSRSQQDALLHAVENRIVILIGATTENPFFEVNTALNSRSRIVELVHLTDDEIKTILQSALVSPRGLDGKYTASDEVLDLLAVRSGGDARLALTTLELACQLAGHGGEDVVSITAEHVLEAQPQSHVPYDKDKDLHYDIISAFIKSMRGSDPDAAVYYLARMIEGGEDPKFIARRIMIFASEDIGCADPVALLVAHAAFKACEVIGYPECRINLAEAAIYMSLASKSNAAYQAINAALKEVRTGKNREVPAHLRDRHRPGAENYPPYQYPHNDVNAFVDQQYLPDGLERGMFYQPTVRGWEATRMEWFKKLSTD